MPQDVYELIPDLHKFKEVRHVTATHGYVVWRYGTGGNVEITHIRTSKPGGGSELLKAMLTVLQLDPPYGGQGTVFGFTRTSNHKAREWYSLMGFHLTPVSGVYAEGSAVVFSATYEQLCRYHNIQPPEFRYTHESHVHPRTHPVPDPGRGAAGRDPAAGG